jgi:hypothetical protein
MGLAPESYRAAFPYEWLGYSEAICARAFPCQLPEIGSVKLVDYAYWSAGVGFTKNNVTPDLRYQNTYLGKGECFVNMTDPGGIISGTGRSNRCSAAFVATLSLDFTADSLTALVLGN